MDVEAYFRVQSWMMRKTKNNRRSRKMMKETMTILRMVMNVIAQLQVMVFCHRLIDGMMSCHRRMLLNLSRCCLPFSVGKELLYLIYMSEGIND